MRKVVGDSEEVGDALADGARALAVRHGHEHGVVAGKRAGNAFDLLGLECAGDGAGGSWLGKNHDQVAGFAHAAQQRPQGVERRDALLRGEEGVGTTRLRGAQSVQIAREHRLRDAQALLAESLLQLSLCGGGAAEQKLADQGAAGGGLSDGGIVRANKYSSR